MRSTKASNAVERLKRRSGNAHYSMVRTGNGLFYLAEMQESGALEKVSEAFEQDDFVAYVNSLGPQQPKRVSKLDQAFEKQLAGRGGAKPAAES
ncbi:hypothetical protein Q8A64_07900 [Oxalobacteraceae bacterium R-40]|uniref:Uncharacterized protein n=1 Tax=Keguizhuia sedimenti TaxID=3064264 RepID=A0ABU1BNA8_9BURK|nr:hypothetical protein [Oxalobacteraceae bacterium R-40]